MRIAFLTIVALAAALPSAGQTGILIEGSGHRPLVNALDRLEMVFGAPVNYEDPPYENEADLQGVASAQQRESRPQYRNLVPRIGQVTAHVRAADDVITHINALLASYRQNRLPGDFQVKRASGMVYVTPTRVLGANGQMRNVVSPLTAVVTVARASRNVAETLQAIFDQVQKTTKLKIAVGTMPFWPTDVVTFEANNEPARDALARLFVQTGKRPLSYRLLFDPKPNPRRVFDYMLNVQLVGRK